MGEIGLYCLHSKLVAAMNPCPCGFFGDTFRQCVCPPGLVVDIFVEVPHIDYEKLSSDRLGEKSSEVQARLTAARARQLRYFAGTGLT